MPGTARPGHREQCSVPLLWQASRVRRAEALLPAASGLGVGGGLLQGASGHGMLKGGQAGMGCCWWQRARPGQALLQRASRAGLLDQPGGGSHQHGQNKEGGCVCVLLHLERPPPVRPSLSPGLPPAARPQQGCPVCKGAGGAPYLSPRLQNTPLPFSERFAPAVNPHQPALLCAPLALANERIEGTCGRGPPPAAQFLSELASLAGTFIPRKSRFRVSLCHAGHRGHLPPEPPAAELMAREGAGSFAGAEDARRQMRVLQMRGTSGGRALGLLLCRGWCCPVLRERAGEALPCYH